MAKASDNVFPKVYLGMQTSDIAAPSDSRWEVYSKAGGVYARSSNSIVGPFASSSGVGSATLGDSHIFVAPNASFYTVDAGTWTIKQYTDAPTAAGSPFMGSGLESAGAQNEAISWQFFLAAGTWTANFRVRKSTNTGIITLNLDAASQGTADTYNASVLQATVSITGWTVSTTGLHTVQLKMATKNASSSNYFLGIFAMQLIRTA